MSQELSDILSLWIVPVVSAILLIWWIGALHLHLRKLEKENTHLRAIVVKHEGVDIFAD